MALVLAGEETQGLRIASRVLYLLVEKAIQDSNDEALQGQRERTTSEYDGLATRCPQSFYYIFLHPPPGCGLGQVFGEREGGVFILLHARLAVPCSHCGKPAKAISPIFLLSTDPGT